MTGLLLIEICLLGKISYVTLLTFVGLQTIALPLSFLLSPPNKTIRKDGSPVVVDGQTPLLQQLKLLWQTVSTKKVGLFLPIFFSSWVCSVSFADANL